MYPFKLKPEYTYTIWGNNELAKIRKDPQSHGTSWDISAHPHADNVILNGPYKGKRLSEMLDEYPEEMLGEKKRSQMLRVAILDSKESLSIQVHPNNEYAHLHENDEGKTEAWYILKAQPDSTLIAGTTAKSVDEIKQAVKEDKIEEYVRKIEMNDGDFICIDAGQLHALGAGFLALEVGQNSDTTYRFYDFHRKDSQGNERELHLEKCYDVVDCTKQCEKTSFPFDVKYNETILDKEEFLMELIDVEGTYEFIPNQKTFYCLSNVLGNMELIYEGEMIPFEYTESIFVPAKCKNIQIKGKGRIIISYVK